MFKSKEASSSKFRAHPDQKLVMNSQQALSGSPTYLLIDNCPAFARWSLLLARLPDAVILLDDSPGINNLPALPSSLNDLPVYNCAGITSLPELPSSLRYLLVDNCPGITSLPELPSSLTTLKILNCPGITSLPELPSSLSSLWLFNCPGITSRPLVPSLRVST